MIAFPIFKIFSIIVITAFGYKNKEENPIYIYQKNVVKKNMLIIINRKRRKDTLCYYKRI